MEFDTQGALSQYQIEIGIKVELNRLEELNAGLIYAARASAEAETAFKIAYAKARLNAKAQGKITESTADDIATAETGELRLAYATTQNSLMANRENVSSCRAKLDALRTLSSSSRSASFIPSKRF